MVRVLPYLDTAAQLRHLRVSLPLVACLLDGVKYCEPDDEPLPEDAAEARQQAPRGPTLRAMVRHVVRAVDAEADDARLRRRQRAQALVAYGLRQIEIAEALGVSKQTITQDLAAARGNVTAR